MAIVNSVEKNYFGVTLYITTRTGKNYACQVVSRQNTTGGGAEVIVKSWPGYGTYRGKLHLGRKQRQSLDVAYKLEV